MISRGQGVFIFKSFDAAGSNGLKRFRANLIPDLSIAARTQIVVGIGLVFVVMAKPRYFFITQ